MNIQVATVSIKNGRKWGCRVSKEPFESLCAARDCDAPTTRWRGPIRHLENRYQNGLFRDHGETKRQPIPEDLRRVDLT